MFQKKKRKRKKQSSVLFVDATNKSPERAISEFKRKVKNSNLLGFQVSIPYYIKVISKIDLIYIPIIGNKGVISNNINIEYFVKYGQYGIYSSLIRDRDNNIVCIELKNMTYKDDVLSKIHRFASIIYLKKWNLSSFMFTH